MTLPDNAVLGFPERGQPCKNSVVVQVERDLESEDLGLSPSSNTHCMNVEKSFDLSEAQFSYL